MFRMRVAVATLLLLACGRTENFSGQGGGAVGGGTMATGGGSAATGGGGAGGGGGAVDGGQDAGLPLSQYCAQLAAHVCGREERCSFLDPAQETDCMALAARDCQTQVDTVNDGRYAYDPSSVASCFTAIDVFDCRNGRAVQPSYVYTPYQCYAVLGTAAAPTGHSCASDYDCADGYCDDRNGACPVCAPFLTLNQPCQLHGCDPRVAYCDVVSQACQPVFATGQGPCEYTPFSCALHSYCAYGVDGGPRLCQLHKADGLPCSNGDECLAHQCNENRYGADAGPSVCGLDAVGGACGFNDDCASGICSDSVCVPPASNQPTGARCGNDTQCEPSLYCEGDTRFKSTCQPRHDAGTACASDDNCLPGMACSDWLHVCVVLGHQGRPCGALDAGGSADSRECTEMLWCKTDNGIGICVPQLALNDACTDQMAVCSEGSCTADGDGGESCAEPGSDLGKVCAVNSDCQSGRCLQGDGGYLDAFHPSGICADFCQ